MTDSRFENLVNLYLDKEITPDELSDLKAEIAHNLVRRKSFERLCRVHSASRKALIDHSVKSGVTKFLKEEVSTVESKRGKRTRIRMAGSQSEADKRAKEILWQGTVAFILVIMVAGLLTAYLIDKTARGLQQRQANQTQEEDKNRTLDFNGFREQLAQLNNGEKFILASTTSGENQKETKVFVLRWESYGPSTYDADSQTPVRGQWTVLEIAKYQSPTEAYEIECELKRCAGQLPGTSAPAALPPPSASPLLLTGNDNPLIEGR